MTKIKICGLMTISDIKAVNQAHADFAGFIFAGGRHHVNLDQALKLRAELDERIPSIGVFVDASMSEMLRIVNSGAVSIIQLHGNESEETITILHNHGVKVIQVFKSQLSEVLRTQADYLMIDSGKGDGQALNWDTLQTTPDILAGAIDLTNVDGAIDQVHPQIIDVSRGVETDNKKDPLKIKQMVNRVHEL
ncbi:phosphoribosylanthranilate isomerase [Companilactobacillus jidongensis]|uniref:phosphoribosylanthranilate isomerase n=1 Tax=Companilactobacillus jidongensis TaxID=2486006 RepID=UPI000F772550|nr:phosphoribosylanthranilate isomerase [Companilactobacillus jidongensis]